MKISHRSAERLQWAYLCRVVAIYGVVLIRSCGATFYQYGKIPLSDWLAANFLDSLVRSAVPLFMMLSGALTLRDARREGSLQKAAQRIIKVLLPLLTWSGIYLMWVSYNSGVPPDWLSILSQPAMYHLWFVYMIIGIYLLIPLFQTIFESIKNRHHFQLYFFTLWFGVTCIPDYWPHPQLSLLQQNSLSGYGGYFLIGGFIASAGRNRLSSFVWLLILLSSVLATFGITWYLSWQANAPVETGYLDFSPNVLVSAISAFVLFTRARVSTLTGKLLEYISDKIFLIFFVHVLVMEYVRYSDFISVVSQNFPMLITILIISIATFVLSLVVASFVRLVPGAKRVFG